jgi:hypothetical protein
MTTSAYNLGNAGLASKILRTKDLTRVAGVEGVPVLGIGGAEFSADGRMRPSLREFVLGVRWGIPQCRLLRFLSKGCASQE